MMTTSPCRRVGAQALFDIGEEARAVHGAIEHTRRGDLVASQGGDECRRLPMAVRDAGEQALAAQAAAIAPRHVGGSTGLVDEDKACGVQAVLACIGPLLFSGSL
jgi:hypothetical protein